MLAKNMSEERIEVERAFWFATEYHTAHNFATCEAPAHDLHNTYVVYVEVLWIWWHDSQGGFGYEGGECILVAVLLRCDCRLQGGSK